MILKANAWLDINSVDDRIRFEAGYRCEPFLCFGDRRCGQGNELMWSFERVIFEWRLQNFKNERSRVRRGRIHVPRLCCHAAVECVRRAIRVRIR